MNVAGSRAVRPKSRVRRNCEAQSVAPAPIRTPRPTSQATRASTRRTTVAGSAPSAIRTPISVRRRLTAYTVTP